MNVICAVFAARRYWSDEEELQRAYETLKSTLPFQADRCALVTEEREMEELTADAGDDLFVAIPISGAIQQMLLTAAARCPSVLLYAAYVPGNAPKELTDAMLKNNSAPPIVDCWSVLRRTHPQAFIAVTGEEAGRVVAVLRACSAVKRARLLMVGEPEPWVVSASRDMSRYEALGIQIEKVPQEEIRRRYTAATEADAAPYYSHFRGLATQIEEPTDADLHNACRMAFAIVETLKAHHADGMAIACFKLLETGTNSCLGVSYINDCTPWVAACEGDMDSAVTMLMMKQLTARKLWMANCGLHADRIMNFSHCTAPVDVLGTGNLPCVLRNHHESGIGVSLQVQLPPDHPVTACRVSAVTGQATILPGTTRSGPYEPVCRTRIYVQFQNPNAYLDKVLGCHQVFAFADIRAEMDLLCKLMGFAVL